MKMDFKEISGGFMVTVSYTEQKTSTDIVENSIEEGGMKGGMKSSMKNLLERVIPDFSTLS